MNDAYFCPVLSHVRRRPHEALSLGGTGLWFSHAIRHRRDAPPEYCVAGDLPLQWQERLTAPRAPVAGLDMGRTHLMGIVNVTPDSFSDGGRHDTPDRAVAHAKAMHAAGASLLDIGGESTRPGAQTVPEDEEIRRTAPVIERLSEVVDAAVISIDTRKAAVARAAVAAGAGLVNDVSGLTYDPDLAPYCAGRGLPVCIMHAQGDPETMQANPSYDNVLLDVYDFLETQVAKLEDLGLPRSQIIVDPGIGFGKTVAHNLTLLNGLALFHGLGCPLLVGASRKRFIGTISGVEDAPARVHGSVSVALSAMAQGAQILRVHDVAETAQAAALWQAISFEDPGGTLPDRT